MVKKNLIHLAKIQKVLPTVYEDSLSYYEVLSKLIYEVENILSLVPEYEKEFMLEVFPEVSIEGLTDEQIHQIKLSTLKEMFDKIKEL